MDEQEGDLPLEEVKAELDEQLEVDASEIQTDEPSTPVQEPAKHPKETNFLPAAKAPVKAKNLNMYNLTASLAPVKVRTQKTNKGVHTNPTFIQWPTDRWGITKDLKSAFIQIASRIAGSADKKELVDETLRIALGHMNQKFKADKVKREELAE